MIDRDFRGGYLAGGATALALEAIVVSYETSRPDTARLVALALVVLFGLALVVPDRWSGARQRRRRHRDIDERNTAESPLHPGPPSAGGDSIASGARPETPIVSRHTVGTSAAPPSPAAPRAPDPPGERIRAEPPRPAPGRVRQPEAEAKHADSLADGASPQSSSASTSGTTGLVTLNASGGVSPRSPSASEPPGGPTAAAPEPTPPEPNDLIRVWQDYWRTGDGHFSTSGLERQLTDSSFTAKVIDGTAVGAGKHVQIVDPQSENRRVYVLPSFATSPRSVQRWFDDRSDGTLTGTTRRVIAVAVGRLTDSGTVEIVKKGAVS